MSRVPFPCPKPCVLAHPQTELPRVNPAFKGKPYRYAYSVSAKPPCTADNALAKYDLERGETMTWFEAGALPTGAPLGL